MIKVIYVIHVKKKNIVIKMGLQIGQVFLCLLNLIIIDVIIAATYLNIIIEMMNIVIIV
jgi:hypothetical protein